MSHSLLRSSLVTTMVLVGSSVFAQNTTTTTATYDNWTMRCSTRAEADKKMKTCQIDSTAFVKLQSGQTTPVLGMTLQRLDPAQPMKFHVNVQLMSLIQNGVKILGAEDKEILQLKYDLCRTDMCETSAEVQDAQIQELKKLNDKAFILYKAFGQQGAQDVRVEVSMKGFSAAYDAMLKEMPKK